MDAETYLKTLSPLPLQIEWHENRSSYLSVRKQRHLVELRLHRFFLEAPTPVLEALIRYAVRGDKKAKPLIRQMAHLYYASHTAPSDLLNPKGRHYDLQEIYTQIKADLFTADYNASIGWGEPPHSSCFRHITFGTYDRHRNQIRIHPFLDDPEVPLYFVSFIVYHEMLHATCLPTLDSRGYSRSHTREFRSKEKLFPQYELAKKWEAKSLPFLKKRNQHGRT